MQIFTQQRAGQQAASNQQRGHATFCILTRDKCCTCYHHLHLTTPAWQMAGPSYPGFMVRLLVFSL